MQTGTTADEDTVGMVPEPPDRRVPERPVFVDASGRRQRRVRRAGRILMVPAIGYIGLLVSTLLGGPTVSSPYLPLPAGPHSTQGDGSRTGPHKGAGGPTHGSVGGSGTATTAGTRPGTGGAAPTPGATTTAAPTPSATSPAPGVTHGRSTHTATPPGASHQPTKKAKTQG